MQIYSTVVFVIARNYKMCKDTTQTTPSWRLKNYWFGFLGFLFFGFFKWERNRREDL